MDDINFNQIRRLWNLKLVVDTGSIKRAAMRANVTSSAISQSISGLETSVGRKLLLRKRDGLLPTEYGAQLLRSAEPAFGVCSELQRNLAVGCEATPKLAWLDFAASPSLAVDVLPETMRRLRARFPDIRLKAKTGRSCELTKLVKKGELCMAAVEENDFMEDGVTAIKLADERLGFYRAADARGADLFASLGVGALAPGADGHAGYYRKFLKALGSSFKATLTAESEEVLRAAAVAGAIVAILPTRVANRRQGELVEIEPPGRDAKAARPAHPAGRYGLYLVSEPGCTPEENVFLAGEIKAALSGA